MFESAKQILSHYVDRVTAFNIHFIEAYRSENIEAIFYLCQVRDTCYIVYETDYIGELESILKEATEIFPDAHFVRWLTTDKTNANLTADNLKDRQTRQSLILSLEGTPMRYVVFEVRIADISTEHYNPTTYGAVSS